MMSKQGFRENDNLRSPFWLELGSAVSLCPSVIDDDQGGAEQDGDDPGETEHDVRPMNCPLVVGEGEADGLEKNGNLSFY